MARVDIDYDLIVVGGGTGGVMSALAAASEGLRVAIIDKNTYLGGMAAGSGLTEMNGAGFQGKPLYRGIENEIFTEMIENGDAEYHFAVPMSSNPNVKIDRLRYNPEMLKILLERKAMEKNIDIFFDSQVVEAQENEDACKVRIQSTHEVLEMTSSFLIDATGNANIVRMLGEQTIRTEPASQLISTLMIRLSNVDVDRLNEFIMGGGIPAVVKEGYEQGILKGKILAFSPIPGTKDTSLNVTRAKIDYENTADVSRGIMDARAQIVDILAYVKAKVPGTEHAYISNIAPMFGVREAQRIEGEYVLTIDDLDQMKEFPDNIACGCYPMDIHDPVTNSVIWKMLPGVYHIPFRSILPKKLNRTLVIGKAISVDKKAFGATRVMPIVMNVGESAGYITAWAVKQKAHFHDLSADEIASCLAGKYCS